MKRFLNPTFFSAVLMSVALLSVLPSSVTLALTWRTRFLQPTSNYFVYNYQRIEGFAGLAIILMSLIVLWTGYQKRLIWTWFLMLIVTWLYYFPVFVLPLCETAWDDATMWRRWFANPLVDGRLSPPVVTLANFTGMIVATFISVRPFFLNRGSSEQDFSTEDAAFRGGDSSSLR